MVMFSGSLLIPRYIFHPPCPALFYIGLVYMNFITKAPLLTGMGLAKGRHQQNIKGRRQKLEPSLPGPQADSFH